MFHEQFGVNVDALLGPIVPVNGHKVIPGVVVRRRVVAQIPVSAARTIRGESHFPTTGPAKLPASTAVAALGYPRLPVTVRILLDPSGNRKGRASREHGLTLLVVDVDVMVACSEVKGFSAAERRIRGERTTDHRAIVLIARGITGIVLIEQPLTQQTDPARGVEPIDSGNHFQIRTVVECRGNFLVRMPGNQSVRGTPFVSQVTLDFLAFRSSQETVEDKNLGNVSLEEIALRKIFPTELDVENGFVGVEKLEDFGGKTIHTARQKVEFARTEDAGSQPAEFGIQPAFALSDDKNTYLSAHALDG